MRNKTYYINFENTPLAGKGPVNESGYEGWYEMDQVSGFDVLEDFYNSVANIFNQHYQRPNKPGEIHMSTHQLNAINALLNAKLTNDVIKKITIHRMRDNGEGLAPDKMIVLEEARVVKVGRKYLSNEAEICLSGFAKEEMIDFETLPTLPTQPFHFEYDAVRGLCY